MEKKLELVKNSEEYVLQCDEFSIKLDKLKIDTKELYDYIYSKNSTDDNDFKVSCETKLTSKEDIRICNQLNLLFSKINDAINKQFDLQA